MAPYRGWFALAGPSAIAPRPGALSAPPARGRLAWCLVGLVLAWAVAQGALLRFEGDPQAAVLANVIFLLGTTASLLAHEAAQGLVARARGDPARDAALLGVGAGAEWREQPRAWAAELVAAILGPVVALLLSFAVVVLARAAYVSGAADPLVRALAAVASFNIVIAAANLLPILPLDGGRLLRALVWRFTRSLERASQVATAVSKAAVLMIVAPGHGRSAPRQRRRRAVVAAGRRAALFRDACGA